MNKIEFTIGQQYLSAIVNDNARFDDAEDYQLFTEFVEDAMRLIPHTHRFTQWSYDLTEDTSFTTCEICEKKSQCYTVYLHYKEKLK